MNPEIRDEHTMVSLRTLFVVPLAVSAVANRKAAILRIPILLHIVNLKHKHKRHILQLMKTYLEYR